MLLSHRRQRLVAAMFASVALAAASARPLLACDAVNAATPTAAEAAPRTAQAPAHAHHAIAIDVGATSVAPDATVPTPMHVPACDHVIGCAVVAIAAAPSVPVLPAHVATAPTRAFVSLIDAPVRAIEPPPPRTQA